MSLDWEPIGTRLISWLHKIRSGFGRSQQARAAESEVAFYLGEGGSSVHPIGIRSGTDPSATVQSGKPNKLMR